jgi:hypothetical protein
MVDAAGWAAAKSLKAKTNNAGAARAPSAKVRFRTFPPGRIARPILVFMGGL